MHRFFVPPTAIANGRVIFERDVARQLHDVLRFSAGQTVVVFDGSGQQWTAQLVDVTRTAATAEILNVSAPATESPVFLTLFQALLKADHFEWVLQKGTELGVSRFVPLLATRCVASAPADVAKKLLRWRRIVQEAAEQSGRVRVPDIVAPMNAPNALLEATATTDVALFCWENEATHPLKHALREPRGQRVAVFVGPEGGFTEAEADLARASGAAVVTLGSRILRAETAALAAAAAIFYALE